MILHPPRSTLFPTRRSSDLVKCQASSEIAGSPRNVFRYSLGVRHAMEVAHWIGDGASRLLTQLKRRMPWCDTGSETRSEEHTSELQSQSNLVCRLLLEKKKH